MEIASMIALQDITKTSQIKFVHHAIAPVFFAQIKVPIVRNALYINISKIPAVSMSVRPTNTSKILHLKNVFLVFQIAFSVPATTLAMSVMRDFFC